MEYTYKLSPERLREAIDDSPMNLKEICRLSRVSRAAIYKWLGGATANANMACVSAAASVLDVNVDWLMGCDVPKRREKEFHRNIREDIDEALMFLDDEQIYEIYKTVMKYKEGNRK